MKKGFLLPSVFKSIGWTTFFVFLPLAIACMYYQFRIPWLQLYYPEDSNWEDYNLTDEFAYAGVIIGLLMVSFARLKDEDEFIRKLRLESLQWAVVINYAVLLVSLFAFYGTIILAILAYNTLTILIAFILKFYYSMYILKKNLAREDR